MHTQEGASEAYEVSPPPLPGSFHSASFCTPPKAHIKGHGEYWRDSESVQFSYILQRGEAEQTCQVTVQRATVFQEHTQAAENFLGKKK